MMLARTIRRAAVLWTAANLLSGAEVFCASPATFDSSGVVGLGFEELIKIQVTSVSRREESQFQTASAVYVITAEDIRRSGAVTIPDVLRLAPGLHVAQTDAHTWAITSRGFNSITANKILVLIDGRIVYSPLFAGTFWDVQDTYLPDIERIEVIRGPGASSWGPNAVNGVINIITKNAKDTQSDRVGAIAGTQHRAVGARTGRPIGSTGHYRAFVKHSRRDELTGATGEDGSITRGGFRADGESNIGDWRISGETYAGEFDETRTLFQPTAPLSSEKTIDVPVSGAFLLGNLRRPLGTGTVELQTYVDRTKRHIASLFHETRDSFEVTAQHRFRPWRRHDLLWGFRYYNTTDRIGDTFTLSWEPNRRTVQYTDFFINDEVMVLPKLKLTGGLRLHDDDFSNLRLQPRAQVAWLKSQRETVWASISRAYRTPTHFDRDLVALAVAVPGTPPSFLAVAGSDRAKPERLTAYDAGYRVQPSERVSVDLSAFFNEYDNLRSLESGPAFLRSEPAPHIVSPFFLENRFDGYSYGTELVPRWQVNSRWRLEGHWTYLRVQLMPETGSADVFTEKSENNDPRHQVQIRSRYNVSRTVQFDAGLRHVDKLPNLGIPAYTVGDVRIGWNPRTNLSLDLIGENLLERRHREFGANQIRPSARVRATWRFSHTQ